MLRRAIELVDSSRSSQPPPQLSRWELLAERESQRVRLSRVRDVQSSAERFYDVTKSRTHRSLNRYSDILAYDRTAVRIIPNKHFAPVTGSGLDDARGQGMNEGAEGEAGYINANVVLDGYGGWWVAAQAPIPEAFPAFVHALKTRAASNHPLVRAQTRGAIIVQLTGYEERGMKKADRYLHTFKHLSSTEDDSIGSVVTEMQADEVEVTHYHFTAWPDHGVPRPTDQPALRALILEVGRRQKAEKKEVWVHCSAGVGRSGAFIALSSLLLRDNTTYSPPSQSSPLGPLLLPESDRVAHTIDALREYRGMLVQTPEQMKLVDRMAGERS